MRLIDADALKEKKVYSAERHERIVPVAEIDWMPIPVWISVKDRLPELGREVLVYAVGKADGFIGHHVYALCDRFVQRIFSSAPGHEMWSLPWDYFHTDYEITHWMPLPEPPKEDTDGNAGLQESKLDT